MSKFLVIGSGIAGLSFALKVAGSGRVAILTKHEALESNTNYAQGGIASVFGDKDSFEQHIADTLSAGAGLCHADVVERVTFWNLHDGQSWLNYFPWRRANHPLLFDRDRKPKPAFDAVIRALTELPRKTD